METTQSSISQAPLRNQNVSGGWPENVKKQICFMIDRKFTGKCSVGGGILFFVVDKCF
jgi:hypothetical protein